ncbi:MAG: TrpB-like pyridoxal phosphate-dependent enzyme [Candidatus Bipolaricaulota bacterium]|nr:TrpB-like pyridoxal phosphate-dependent enzyme [Candidatus Bipolaricaulota bacterium]
MKTVFLLHQEELPRSWYNVLSDLGRPLDPPLDPQTGAPISPDALAVLFPRACLEQEVATDRFIPIPEPVQEAYRRWRPTPLARAVRLERALGTPARIYFKYEGGSPTGSHKANTALAQAYYNRAEGTRRLTTETGAGQWGSALAFACATFGLRCTVYMVRSSYEGKPYRRTLIRLFGAEIHPSPSDRTAAGRAVLARDPDSPGSLGIAISEAIEDARRGDGTKYALGSVLNHVLLHQTVIGLEAIRQMEVAGDWPDVVVGCVGGGSNFAGLALPFFGEARAGRRLLPRLLAVEPTACPSLTRGEYRYDYGDTARTTPLLKMHTLGADFVPPPLHAGGLRYHGMAPIVSRLVADGVVEPVAYDQGDVFRSAALFAQTEGIVPAPETAHAVHAAVELARRCAAEDEAKVILIGFSGHGHFDMAAYEAALAGSFPRGS